MKKLTVLCAMLCIAGGAFAIPDLEFSPGGRTPGGWAYDGINTFSFSQTIDIDAVLGAQTDALYDMFVVLPNLTLTSYVQGPIPGAGVGTIAGGGIVEIQDTAGNVLVSGVLSGGNFYAIFGASAFYPEIATEILITQVNNTVGSNYLNGLSAGMFFDLSLSLQASADFDTIIQSGQTASNGFSGSFTAIIPEPATLSILGLGGMLLLRRKHR